MKQIILTALLLLTTCKGTTQKVTTLTVICKEGNSVDTVKVDVTGLDVGDYLIGSDFFPEDSLFTWDGKDIWVMEWKASVAYVDNVPRAVCVERGDTNYVIPKNTNDIVCVTSYGFWPESLIPLLMTLDTFPNLKMLDLPVTDEDLCFLAKLRLKNLQILRLKAGKLATAEPILFDLDYHLVESTDKFLTDEGLGYLKTFKNLKKLVLDLDMGNPGITSEGINKLQKALPNCKIYIGNKLYKERTK